MLSGNDFLINSLGLPRVDVPPRRVQICECYIRFMTRYWLRRLCYMAYHVWLMVKWMEEGRKLEFRFTLQLYAEPGNDDYSSSYSLAWMVATYLLNPAVFQPLHTGRPCAGVFTRDSYVRVICAWSL